MEKENKLGWGKIIIYGSGDVALNICYTMFASFVLYFYTDTILLNAGLAGTVILVSRLLDGVSDVIAGHIIDHTHAKSGHCIPWLRRCAIPYAVCFVLVFTMPKTTTVGMLVYLFVTYNLFNTVVFTMANLAHYTLPVFVTDDQKTRSTMITMKMFFAGGCQVIIANVTLPAIQAMGGDQMAWIKLSAIYALIGIVITFIYTSVIKEKEVEVEKKEEEVSFKEGLKAAFQNKYWLIALGISITATLQLVFITTISTYYMSAVIGNVALVGTFIIFSNVPGMPVTFFMGKLLNHFSKRTLCIFGTILQLVAGVIFILGPTDSFVVLYSTAAMRGIGFGMVYSLASAMVIDTVEYGEWKTGVRVQGLLTSASTVAQKLANGLGTAVFSMVLTAVAYDGSKAVQAAETVRGIEMVFKWAPMVVLLIQMVLLLAYKLDAMYPDIVADLKKRKEA